MKYLIVHVTEEGKLEWNIVDSKEKVREFLQAWFLPFFERVGYDRQKIYERIHIFEIEPTYEHVSLQVTKPIPLQIILK